MKKYKKPLSAVLSIILIMSVFTSCGSSARDNAHAPESSVDSYSDVYNEEAPAEETADYEASEVESPDGSTGISGSKDESGKQTVIDDDIDTKKEAKKNEQKIIYTYNIVLETKEFQTSRDALYELIDRTESYVESSYTSSPNLKITNGNFSYPSMAVAYAEPNNRPYSQNNILHMVVRVPSDELDGFIKSTSGIAHIVSQDLTSENVSLKYVDMEARRDTIKSQEEALNNLLEKATTTEDIIKLVDRINKLTAERESIERQLRVMDNQVDYSIVEITLNEVGEYKTPVVEKPPTFGRRIARKFRRSVNIVKDAFEDFAVWFIGNIIFIIPVGIIIFFVIKKLIKANKKSREDTKKKKEELEKEKKENPEAEKNIEEDSSEEPNGYYYDPSKKE